MMTYEVYIDVAHRPRHLEWGKKLSTAGKWDKPKDAAPPMADRLRTVAAALRDFADHLDPDWHCTHCGKTRGEHFRPERLPRCLGPDGPITQWAWWQENQAAPDP
jgi:hypothetical protein